VDLQLERLKKMLEGRHISIEVTPQAKALLAAEGYDPVYGARPLKRVIQRLLQNPIALELLEGNFHEGDVIRAERDGDVLRFEKVERAARQPEMAGA
jgi:ATP-dependent Clp protease ATP-binding subunit ClpB